MDRQSERDFPRRSTITDYTTSKRMTAVKHRGNQLCFVAICHTSNAKYYIERFLEKYGRRSQTSKKDLPTADGISKAIADMLCMQK